MAEIEIKEQAIPGERTPVANLPTSTVGSSVGLPGTMKPAAREAVLQDANPAEPLELESFLASGQNMIGEESIRDQVLERARSGSQQDRININTMINNFNRTQTKRRQAVTDELTGESREVARIPMAQYDPVSNTQVVSVPPTLSKKEPFFGVFGVSDYEAAVGYAENRIGLNNAIKELVPNIKVQELISDYYQADFFRQFGFETEDLLRDGVRAVPAAGTYMRYMAMAVKEGIQNSQSPDGMDVFVETERAFEKYKPRIVKEMAGDREAMRAMGFDASFGERINNFMAQKYIERYGQEEFDNTFRPEIGGGNRLIIPLITDEAADAMLAYGFDELPFLGKAAMFFMPNALISRGMAARHLSVGKARLEKYDNLVEKGLIDGDNLKIAPRMALANYEIANEAAKFGSSFRKMRANIGNLFTKRFGYEGPIANARVNRDLDTSVKRISSQIEEIDRKVMTARSNGIRDNEIIQIMGPDKKPIEVSIEEAIQRRAYLSNRYDSLTTNGIFGLGGGKTKNPYLQEVYADELIITGGQTLGYELLPSLLPVDGDVGGAMGALASAFMGRPAIRVTGYVAGKVADKTLVRPMAVQFGRFLEDAHVLPRGLIINREYDDIAEVLGKTLSPEDIQAFSKAADILQKLTPEGQEAVFNSLKRYGELRNNLLARFDPDSEQYKQAQEAFSLTFAYASGLAPLQALEALQTRKFGFKKIAKAADVQLQSEQHLQQARVGMAKLQELIQQAEVKPMSPDSIGPMPSGSVDIKDSSYLKGFIDSFNAAADGIERGIGERRRAYLELVDEYKRMVLKNPGDPKAEAKLKEITDLEIRLTPGAAEDVEAQRTILANNIKILGESLNERAKHVNILQGTPDYDIQMGRLAEEMAEFRDEKIMTLARQVYVNAEKTLGDKQVNLAPVMEDLVKRLAGTQEGALRQFFSADSAFFRGRSGKYALAALNEAAERNLRNVLGEDYDEFRAVSLSPKVQNAAGEVVDNKLFIGSTDASDSELALHYYRQSLKRAGGNADEVKFRPFDAGAFESEEMRRHLLQEADRITKSQGADAARPYLDLALIIDNQIGEIPGAKGVMDEARSEYKRLKFDPVQSIGGYGDKVNKAMMTPRYEEVVTYGRRYGETDMPHTWHDKLGETASNSIARGNNNDFVDFKIEMEGFNRFWADGFEGDLDNAIPVYDMRLPQNSEENFTGIGMLLRNGIQSRWGQQTRSDVLDKIQLGPMGAQEPGVGGSYNWNRVENVRRLQDDLQVKVINEDGTEEFRSWFDLEEMIVAENDIARLVEEDMVTRQRYEGFIELVNRKTGSMYDEAKESLALEAGQQRVIRRAAEISKPEEFYEKYILDYDSGLFEDMRERFVQGYMKEFDVTETEALQNFSKGVTFMITKGLMARAKTEAQATYRFFDGTERTINTFINPINLVSDLEDPNVIRTLRLVMDEDHITYMKEFGEMLMMAQGTSLARMSPDGITRSISPNELISRAFNIARGMVSPTYVGAEFAFRLLQDAEVNAFTLAASNEEANRIMLLLMEDPKLVSEQDVKTLSTIVTSVVIREGIRLERTDSDYFYMSRDEIEAAMASADTERATKTALGFKPQPQSQGPAPTVFGEQMNRLFGGQ